MEHSIHNFVKGYELAFIVGIAKAKADLLAVVPIQAQEALFSRPEFCQDAHTPSTLSHDWFDDRSHFPE